VISQTGQGFESPEHDVGIQLKDQIQILGEPPVAVRVDRHSAYDQIGDASIVQGLGDGLEAGEFHR